MWASVARRLHMHICSITIHTGGVAIATAISRLTTAILAATWCSKTETVTL